MPAGRPSSFTEEIGQAICERIMCGDSVRKLCELDGMPNPDTIYGWLARRTEFAEQYARALKFRAEKYAEELADISDEGTGDAMRDRLRVDTRKWVVSKLLPRVYGDKVAIEHGGEIKVQETPAGVEQARDILRAAGLDS